MSRRIITRRQSLAALRGAARAALVGLLRGLGWVALGWVVLKLAIMTMGGRL